MRLVPILRPVGSSHPFGRALPAASERLPSNLNFTQLRRRSQFGRPASSCVCSVLLCNWQPSLRRDPLTHARHTPTHARALSHTWPCRRSPSGLCPRALALLAHRHFACGFHDTTRLLWNEARTSTTRQPIVCIRTANRKSPEPYCRRWDSATLGFTLRIGPKVRGTVPTLTATRTRCVPQYTQ